MVLHGIANGKNFDPEWISLRSIERGSSTMTSPKDVPSVYWRMAKIPALRGSQVRFLVWALPLVF